MRLYNSKTLKVEEFIPIKENEVSMYVCGPTVYNHIHIGNARPIVVFDTLRRVFEASNYKVNYVSNFTDVDDRIIQKAKEEGVSEIEIANRYMEAYNEVRHSLNTLELSAAPQVTQTMDEIIRAIQDMVDRGYAYEVDGDVYFSVQKVKEYGELSHQNIEDLQVGARVDENDKKENPLDFALWKRTDQGIQWDSPWGKGRPGWHTECVVMIDNEFKHEKIDIHGGGKDLKFPHHENEVAQCFALHNHDLANYWLHNGMLNFDGEKMSKSIGNVVWAKDVIEMLGSNVVRWFLLSVRYRDTLNYNEQTLETAKTELSKIQTSLRQAQLKVIFNNLNTNNDVDVDMFTKFLEAMSDDMNTPNAYAEIFEANKQLNQEVRKNPLDEAKLSMLINTLEKMLDILGIKFEEVVVSEEDKENYCLWNEAKANKDFETADVYRAKLIEKKLI
jgi:cysteinyl-tRNA synthetase